MGLRSESVITKAQKGSNRVRSGRDKEEGGKQGRTGRLELSEVILWAASSSVEDNALWLEKEDGCYKHALCLDKESLSPPGPGARIDWLRLFAEYEHWFNKSGYLLFHSAP